VARLRAAGKISLRDTPTLRKKNFAPFLPSIPAARGTPRLGEIDRRQGKWKRL